jgi:hypothetical protein
LKRTHAPWTRRWSTLILFLIAGWALAPLATPVAAAQGSADPWDVRWLPDERRGRRALDQALDAVLEGTGLHGQGATIRENAERHGVNPAFALAIFRQEAGFARQGTLAQRNKNPANIIATGDCWGQPEGARCTGTYGEVGTDGRFGRYASMADGIEAFFLLMEREYAGMALDDLIGRACPPVECDVPGYVARMEQWTVEYQAQLSAAIDEQRAPDKTAPPQGTEHPVLLARLWKATQTLFPFCCGGGMLVLVLGALAIVYRDRLPFFPLR